MYVLLWMEELRAFVTRVRGTIRQHASKANEMPQKFIFQRHATHIITNVVCVCVFLYMGGV